MTLCVFIIGALGSREAPLCFFIPGHYICFLFHIISQGAGFGAPCVFLNETAGNHTALR